VGVGVVGGGPMGRAGSRLPQNCAGRIHPLLARIRPTATKTLPPRRDPDSRKIARVGNPISRRMSGRSRPTGDPPDSRKIAWVGQILAWPGFSRLSSSGGGAGLGLGRALATVGPGPSGSWAQVGPGPSGPGPKWARAQVGPGPKWARAQGHISSYCHQPFP
jgi:hypothetical protein